MKQMHFVVGLLIALIGLPQGRLLAVPTAPPFGVYEDASYSPTITVLESTPTYVRLHLEMEHLPGGGTVNFTTGAPGLWGDLNQGGVLLPRFTIFVALPSSGNPDAIIESWTAVTLNATPIIVPENNPQPDTILLGHVGLFGGARLVPVTFHPIRYVNNSTDCSVMSEATIRIEVDDEQGENPLANPWAAFSRSWQKVYQAVVTNWEHIPNFYVANESHILMIVPDSYEAAVQDFVRWKEQRGTHVTVVRKSQIGSNPSAQQVRSRIITEVGASQPRIDYVILAGDETQLPVSMLNTPDPRTRFSDQSYAGPYTNEAYFTCIDGSDAFPDVFLGRWVVNSEQEVRKIVRKTVLHERDTFSGDSSRFVRAMVAADNEEASQRMTKQYVRRLLLGHQFTRVDTLWGGSDPQPLINAVDQGVTFVNYRGTGWSDRWYGIWFTVWHIQQLQNTRRLPIVTGISCGCAKFDEDDNSCFGEAWMLAGTLNDLKGAVGFIGPCWNTHTVYNDCLDSLLYGSMTMHDVLNLGPALASGKMMTWGTLAKFLNDNAVNEVTSTLMRQYLILSDPSLQVFTSMPVRLNASIPDVVPNGPYNLTVAIGNMSSVSAESLQVTAWLADGEFVTRWIPANRSTALLPIDASGRDSVIVTITGDNALAYRKRLTVGASGPYLVHLAALLDDSPGGNGNGWIEPGETISWRERLWNIGSETALNVIAQLSSASPDVTITQSTSSLGSIAANDSATAATPFVLAVNDTMGSMADLRFHLAWTMDNGNPQSVDLDYPLHVPNVVLTDLQIVDQNNGDWERGEAVSLAVTVGNTGIADLAAGTATLTTSDPYVTILQGQANIPPLPAGQSYEFPQEAFRAQSAWHTPAGHQATLFLEIRSAMETYTYSVTLLLQLDVAPITVADPFSDTQRRYWFYDNLDSAYTEMPSFDWIEIAPDAGGPGTEINVPRSDYTVPIPLPFSYSFYGTDHDTLSVSTDGWVHPGRTSSTNFGGQRLPYPEDNIAGMIALLWMDLWWQRIQYETGQVCYYYDQTTDRFIVEWYRIHDWRTGSFEETFQLQLLNPATYPTETGDAAWLLLYSEISAHAADPSEGATVGLESAAETEGGTYYYRGTHTPGAASLTPGRVIKITPNAPHFTPVTEVKRQPLPRELSLAQNYPNPFNPETTLEFALPWTSSVSLQIFDVLGRHVVTLVDGTINAGTHRVAWRGESDGGTSVGSGVYFCRLVTPHGVLSRKMILLR